MYILSVDPGTSNFGFASLKIANKAWTLLRCGMMGDTVKELKEQKQLFEDNARYLKRIEWLLRKSKAQLVGAERYIPRRQGISNESINFMLGVLSSTAAKAGIYSAMWLAATWKLRLKKVLDLDALYAQAKPLPPHVVDAVLIGLFTAEREGLYSMEKLGSATQRQRLCKAMNQKFLDLRTTGHAVKHRGGRKKKRKARGGRAR